MAEDGKGLKGRQNEAKQQVKHAQHDLDESSSRLRQTQAAFQRARTALVSARADLRVANAKLTAAQIRDDAMQQRLVAAEARLAAAQQELKDGKAALEAQRLSLTDTITDIYERGDPQLLAFSSLLNSRSTTDLTRQEAYNNAVVGRQAWAYDDLHAAEVLLQVRENQVRDARDDVEVERAAAADHLVTMQGLRAESSAALTKVRALVVSSANARVAARSARLSDLRDLRAAKKREARIRQQILAAARRARGGYSGPTGGLLIRPVPGSVTSSYGYREHPIYHYWGLHDGTDFGVSCGEGMKAVAGGTVIAKYWSERLRQPPLRLARQHQRQERHGRLQPRHRLPRRSRRPGAAGRGRRVRRFDRLVDGLSPALHDPGQRHRGRSDEVALTLVVSRLRRPEKMVGWPRRPGAS